MEDLHKVGGVPALVKYLLKNTNLIDGSQLTVTGKTLAENYEDVPDLDFETQSVVRPLSNPIKEVRRRPLPPADSALTCILRLRRSRAT